VVGVVRGVVVVVGPPIGATSVPMASALTAQVTSTAIDPRTTTSARRRDPSGMCIQNAFAAPPASSCVERAVAAA
jgi:hypothetical protein